MVQTSFSDANTLNIFTRGSLLPGHTVSQITVERFTVYNLVVLFLNKEKLAITQQQIKLYLN